MSVLLPSDLRETVHTTNIILDKLGKIIVFHELQPEIWAELLALSKEELESVTRGAITSNQLGGLSDPSFQLRVINITNRIEILERLLHSMQLTDHTK